MRVSRKISIYRAQRSQQGCSLSLGMLRLAEPPTGRARLRSSLKSPRNPITPFEASRVATLHPGLYKWFREGARRVIGATAKPLYPIDGKAGGLDRRNPRPPSSREGDRPVGGGRSYQAVEGVNPIFEHKDCKKTSGLLYYNIRSGLPSAVPAPHPSSERTWQREKAHPLIFGHPRRVRPDFC